MIMNSVKDLLLGRHVNRSDTCVDVTIEVLQVKSAKRKQATKHGIRNRNLETLEDDVGECNDNRVDRV